MTTNSIDIVMGRVAEIGSRISGASSRRPGEGFAESLEAAQRSEAAPKSDRADRSVTLGSFLGRPVVGGSADARPGADWVAGLPPEGQEYAEAIAAAAHAAGIDPALLASVVWAESEFVASAESPAGALGLTQLMPATAEILGVDPLNVEENLRGGAQFLADMLQRYGGDVELALAAYNSGPGTVDATGGIPEFTEAYIMRVLGHLDSLGGERLMVDLRVADVPTVSFADTAPAPTPIPVPAVVEVVPGGIAQRIMDAIDLMRSQPPPRRMVVEIPELDGARITVALRGGNVVLSSRDSELATNWLPSIEAALERHGLDTGRERRGDPREESDQQSDPVGRRQREVIMEGADS